MTPHQATVMKLGLPFTSAPARIAGCGYRICLSPSFFFAIIIFIGAIAELETVWAFGDAALGFMSFPNLLSIILLSGVLKKLSKDYFSIKHIEYKSQKEN